MKKINVAGNSGSGKTTFGRKLAKALLQHIAKFKMPRYMIFTDQPLPRIASGKMNKRLLRDEAPARFHSPQQQEGT